MTTIQNNEMDFLSAGVLTIVGGKVAAANRTACALLGDVVGIRLEDLTVGAAPPGGEPAQMMLQRKVADALPVLASAAPGPDGGMIIVFQDLSAVRRKEAEQQAGRERASRARMRFLASASHDLRQPLQALALFTSALEGQADPGLKRITEAMKSSLGTMEQMFERLLDLFRLEAGAISAQNDDFLAADAFDGLETREGVRLVPSEAAICSDARLLRRILGILVGCAQARSPKVLVGCRRQGEELRFEVWDGVDDPDRARILSGEEAGEEGDKIDPDTLDLMIVSRLAQLLQAPLAVAAGRVGLTVPLSSGEE